ncbi:MAG: transcriptional regulator [Spirochaetia bacterium]|nr:transcriptional regulator [Spirochaetia bacterium]
MIESDLLYKVAYEYYVNKKIQREIADELNVSRVQVSKYLSMAEEAGIVRIEVIKPQVDSSRLLNLRKDLKDFFQIENVLIAPSYGKRKPLENTLHLLAKEYLFSHYSEKPLNIGLGWGSTIYSLVASDFNEKRKTWKIIPLTGGSALITSKYFNINHMAHMLAEKVEATPQPVYLPLLAATQDRDMIMEREDYQMIHTLWSSIDLIICSVGYSIPRSPLFKQGLIGNEYIDKLEKNQVVGDILTHYFNEYGEMVNIGIENKMINISTDQIAMAQKKLIIAYGEEKVRSILGGLRSGLIDVLITDADTAEAVLELAEKQGG